MIMKDLQQPRTDMTALSSEAGFDTVGLRISRSSPYKWALALVDIVAAVSAFILCVWLAGILPVFLENSRELISLVVFSWIMISFFTTYNLYNYHIIFLRTAHLINLAKSFFWSALSFCIIVFLYMWPNLFQDNALFIGIFLFAGVLIFLLFASKFGDQLLNFIKSMGVALVVLGINGFLLDQESPLLSDNLSTILFCVVLAMALIVLSRMILVHLIFNRVMKQSFRRQIVIVGSDEDAKGLTSNIIEKDAPFWVAGIICAESDDFLDVSVPKTCLGSLKELPDIVKTNKIDEIIVTDEYINKRVLISLLDYGTSMGISVWFSPKLLKIIDTKLYIDRFCGIPMIRLCSQKNSWLFNKIKHSIDMIIALPIFILQLPLFIGIATAIKVNSKGPVFYRADAIGRNGEPFKMNKFRSMRVDTDNTIHKEYVQKLIKGEIGGETESCEPLKIVNDPRITSVGEFIRKYSFDELPQLLNVLVGDMSLVGPRPCLPYEYEEYKDWHKKRVVVRPGITGLWQVTGRSEVSFEDMILLDLYYIYNRSLLLDFNILFETFFVVISKRGAY